LHRVTRGAKLLRTLRVMPTRALCRRRASGCAGARQRGRRGRATAILAPDAEVVGPSQGWGSESITSAREVEASHILRPGGRPTCGQRERAYRHGTSQRLSGEVEDCETIAHEKLPIVRHRERRSDRGAKFPRSRLHRCHSLRSCRTSRRCRSCRRDLRLKRPRLPNRSLRPCHRIRSTRRRPLPPVPGSLPPIAPDPPDATLPPEPDAPDAPATPPVELPTGSERGSSGAQA
jgi:hypothetical protein